MKKGKKMKGIVLAGGSGTRLYPLTIPVSKQLMPIYDKPLVYYPMSVLMLAGIREVLVISTPHDLPCYQKLFQDGSHLGMKISYAEQARPEGLAQAFIIGEKFIGGDNAALILGDNLFYGNDLAEVLQKAGQIVLEEGGGLVFAYHVSDPERYGVVEFNDRGEAVSLEEKPANPKSHFAVTGIYFYDNEVVRMAKNLKSSARGELEITDINKIYLKASKLRVQVINRGTAWLDTGTHQSLLEAGNFVKIIEERQGLKIGCIEEVAYRMGYINRQQLEKLGQSLVKSGYGKYLLEMAAERDIQ
jgi:glucose-1-phosphate thymidylyltransferase